MEAEACFLQTRNRGHGKAFMPRSRIEFCSVSPVATENHHQVSELGPNQEAGIIYPARFQVCYGPVTSAKQEMYVGLIPELGRSPEKEMGTNSHILAWEVPWTGEPGGLQSMGLQRVRHNLATKQQQE